MTCIRWKIPNVLCQWWFVPSRITYQLLSKSIGNFKMRRKYYNIMYVAWITNNTSVEYPICFGFRFVLRTQFELFNGTSNVRFGYACYPHEYICDQSNGIRRPIWSITWHLPNITYHINKMRLHCRCVYWPPARTRNTNVIIIWKKKKNEKYARYYYYCCYVWCKQR